jgi:hypothetical protein
MSRKETVPSSSLSLGRHLRTWKWSLLVASATVPPPQNTCARGRGSGCSARAGSLLPPLHHSFGSPTQQVNITRVPASQARLPAQAPPAQPTLLSTSAASTRTSSAPRPVG